MSDWDVYKSTPSLPINITPISYTAFCHFSECPLRFGFNKDSSFPSKMNPKARMGSAFHSAIAKMHQQNNLNLPKSIDHFQNELKIQRIESMNNYRERNLPWPRDLREILENTIAVIFSNRTDLKCSGIKSHIETILISKDKLIIGRPDTVLITPKGPIIIDYKTGHFDYDSIVDYEDQIYFYAGLWQEIRGDYPILGRIEFLLDGYDHDFPINKDRCISILTEARNIANTLDHLESKLQAKRGDHCIMCDYRPWCNEYWSHDRQSEDFEGIICSEHPRDSQSFCLKSGKTHQIIVNRSTFPIPDWEIGTRVRILDPMVTGDIYSKGIYSEIYRVV